MKGFRFRLEPVLHLRRQAEQEKLADLAAAMQAVQQAQQHTSRLAGQLDEVTHTSADPAYLQLRQQQVEHLERSLAAARSRIDEAQFACTHARAAAAEAAAEVRAVEKLREKQYNAWQDRMHRHEELQLAEAAQTQTHRRREQEMSL